MLLVPEKTKYNPIDEALRLAGLKKSGNTTAIAKVLEENGLGLEELSEELASTIRCAESPSDKLRGIEMAYKMHGVMKDEQKVEAPQIVFNIQGDVNLEAILAPQR